MGRCILPCIPRQRKPKSLIVVINVKKTFRPEIYKKLNSWINKCGGDLAFGKRIAEAPRTIQELIYSDEELMVRFGLKQPTEKH